MTDTTKLPLDQLKENIPHDMIQEDRWIIWKAESRSGKITKIPYQIDGATCSKSNDPETWSSYNEAISALKTLRDRGFELGFMLGDGFAGVDFDLAVVGDGVKVWAKDLYDQIKHFSYVEFSPSGTGFKATFKGQKPEGTKGSKKSFGEGKEGIEVYDKGRFWAITGESISDNFGQADSAFDELCRVHLGGRTQTEPAPKTVQYTLQDNDADAWTRATAYIEKIDGCSEGGRDSLLFNVCGHLWSFGLSEDQVATLAGWFNQNRLSPPMDDFEVKQKIRSSRDNGTPRESKEQPSVTLSSGFSMPLDPSLVSSDVEIEGEEETTEQTFDELFPVDQARDGGMIQRLMDEFKRCSRRSSPEIEFAVALNALTAVTSRLVADDSFYRTTTRAYCAITAPSGSGKNAPLKFVNEVVKKCRPDIEAPNDLTSVAGLLERLSHNPTRISLIDELGDTISEVGSAKKGGSLANSKLHSVLKELATSTWKTNFNPRMVLGHVRNGRDENDLTSQCPHFSIFGVTATDSFYEAFESASQIDGFLGRWMVFDLDKTAKKRRITHATTISDEVVATLQRWATYCPLTNKVKDPMDEEDGLALPTDLMGEPVMKIVQRTPDAANRLEDHYDQADDRADIEEENGEKVRSAIWRRASEKTALLALVFAISRSGAEPTARIEITLEDANRAIAVNNFLTRRMVWEFSQREAMSQWQAKWMPLIQKMKIGDEVTRRDFNRKCRGALQPRELEQAIKTAESAGYLKVVQRSRGGLGFIRLK